MQPTERPPEPEDARALDEQKAADARLVELALGEARQNYAAAKIQWHLSSESIPTGQGGQLRHLEKHLRDHRRTVAKLEELREKGLSDPSDTDAAVIAFPRRDPRDEDAS
jgi:hypothetical protein